MYESKEEVIMGLQQDIAEFDKSFRDISSQAIAMNEQLKSLENEKQKLIGKFEYCTNLIKILTAPDVEQETKISPAMELINSEKTAKTKK